MLHRVESSKGKARRIRVNTAGRLQSNRTLLGFKRISDIIFAAALLALFLPLALVLATWIRLAGARAIERGEEVVGVNGRTFKRWRWGEPKRTGGRWLTKELGFVPPLINVLGGDMAIVGPSPRSARQHRSLAYLTPDHTRLLAMKPGVIGIWDSRGGRSQIQQELNYISTWTPVNDIRILFRRAAAYLLEGNSAD